MLGDNGFPLPGTAVTDVFWEDFDKIVIRVLGRERLSTRAPTDVLVRNPERRRRGHLLGLHHDRELSGTGP